MNQVCCGAVDLSGMIHGEAVFKMNTTTSCRWIEPTHRIGGIYKKNTTVCKNRQKGFEKIVMQNRKKYDAFNLSDTFMGCGLLISAGEHDQNDPPYQAAANNVNTS